MSTLKGMAEKGNGIAEISSGLGSAAVFGALYFWMGSPFFIFLAIITGVVPMIKGISKLAQARVGRKERKQIIEQQHESTERAVLRLAQTNSGRLTPAIVAVNSSVTIDEASAELSALVDKGFAQLEVTEDGRLEYFFPEFVPRTPELTE